MAFVLNVLDKNTGKYVGIDALKGDPGDVTPEFIELVDQTKQNATAAADSASSAQTDAGRAETAADKAISMGLTGMQIGDTVEVASIGPGGVPTGWRKAAGGEWEHIVTYTLTEEDAAAERIILNRDRNGQPFRLTELSIEINATADIKSDFVHLYGRLDMGPASAMVYYWCRNDTGNRFYIESKFNGLHFVSKNGPVYKSGTPTIRLSTNVLQLPAVDELWIGWGNKVAGTTIKLCGRRAKNV